MKQKTIIITDIIKSEFCTSSIDGDRVYTKINDALKHREKVSLSFKGVKDLTTAFLNSAVGRLYNGDYDYPFLNEMLTPTDATNDDLHALKRVVDRAKTFFNEPERILAAEKEVLNDDE